ncbi:UspA domain protein (plasmid) [Halobacterium hubeiense]|uniref:UspA domain protein n=1 Tax=Halobacterium hubeiense TaxID=1407499 RepID=A0A0U5H879_9EURY|nr:universal stress protein [Halobacterium hubeiense]CQH64522.1 UspA domain protein [Halobacterium hubeiense]
MTPSDDTDLSDVRVAVSRPSSSSGTDPYLRDGPRIQTPDPIVVVPVTDELLDTHTGLNVRRFLQTAVAIAADNDGRVLLLGIETVPNEAALETVRRSVNTEQPIDDETTTAVKTVRERQTQLAEVANVARGLSPGVRISAAVRIVLDVTEGIMDVLGEEDETAVLLLRGTGLDEGWLLQRSTIERILADAECDVFVENLGVRGGENALYVPDVAEHTVASLAESDVGTIDSILVPVGAGPHAALATEAARAIARYTDASVTVLHVISPDASVEVRAESEDLLEFADYVLGSRVRTETVLREASNTTDTIVQEAKKHDFVAIGAPEKKSRLEQLVFQSARETISDLSEATILMAHDSDQTMRSLYYRWKRGIEAIDNENEPNN